MPADFITEDIRLCILRLMDSADGSLNNAVLLVGVRRYGHRITLDSLASELDWLAAQGLCTIKHEDGLIVPTLTQRGKDAARGIVSHPGVKEPIPGLG